MADIDTLEIKISADATKANNSIKKLTNSLIALNNAMSAIDPNNLQGAVNAVSGLSSAMSGLRSNGRVLQNVTNSISNISSQNNGLQQTANSTQNLSDALENVSNSTNDAARATAEIGEASNRGAGGVDTLSNASKNAGIAVKAMSAGFRGFTGTLKSVGSFFGSIAKKAASSVTGIKAFSKASKTASNSAKRFAKELTRIGKMLKLMLTRMVLRKIIEGVFDGFKNLAQYSKTFDATLSLLWNDFRQLGNSIAAAVSPLLNAFAPAIHYIIQLCIQAVNAINQLLSALTGLSSWTRAKTLTDSYAKSLEKAGGAAKELKKTVLGFDELNQLQDNKNSGGGGTSPANMFEEVPISDKWKNIADWFKEMWDKADFSELGKLIGEKLRDALESIPWGKIKKTARKIGSSIATLINGFVEVERLGYDIGYTISQALNTAFEFANEFVHKLHWASIGKFIADAFNGFFGTIDWKLIRDTVVTGLQGVATAIWQFITTFKWDNISNFIKNAFDTVAAGIKAFFEQEGYDENGFKLNGTWAQRLGKEIGYQINKAVKEIPWREVGEALGDIIQAAIDFVSETIDQLKWEDFKKAIQDLFSGLFSSINTEDLAVIIGDIGAVAVLAGLGKMALAASELFLAQKFATMFASAIGSEIAKSAAKTAVEGAVETAVTEGAASETVASATSAAGMSLGTAILGGVSAVFTAAAIAQTIYYAVKDVKNYKESLGVDSLWEGLFSEDGDVKAAKRAYANSKSSNPYLNGTVSEGVQEVANSWTRMQEQNKYQRNLDKENIGQWADDAAQKFSAWQEKNRQTRQKDREDTYQWVEDVKKKLTEWVDDIKTKITQFKGHIEMRIGELRTSVKGKIAEIKEDISDTVTKIKGFFSKDNWTFSGVVDGLRNTFRDAKKAIGDTWNEIADKLNGKHSIGATSFSINLPRFASGGFPENGLFMANSTEMVGKFSNGRNAVANNEQITEGIARAVFNAMVTANSSGRKEYINNTIVVDGIAIARAVTQGQQELDRRYSPTMA